MFKANTLKSQKIISHSYPQMASALPKDINNELLILQYLYKKFFHLYLYQEPYLLKLKIKKNKFYLKNLSITINITSAW